MLNFNTVAAHQQIPLIHVVHEDDELLSNSPEAEWYKILQNLPWREYRPIGAKIITNNMALPIPYCLGSEIQVQNIHR